MLEISTHIAALLHRFDCVVIPEMGGFVANYSPAVLDRSKGVVYPPSKGIIFNKNLVKNDGLLISEISHALEIPYNDALNQLNHYVALSKQTLAHGGRIEIDGLGYLYLDAEKNMQYLPHQTVNFLNESFGLFPVMAVPVAKKAVEVKVEEKKVEEKKATDPDSYRDEKTVEKREAVVISINEAKKEIKRNKTRYYWAAAVLLPVLFYSYWIPFQTNAIQSGHLTLNHFNPFASPAPVNYALRAQEVRDTVEVSISLSDVEKYFAGIPVKETHIDMGTDVMTNPSSTETTNITNPPVVTHSMRFHVIGGCFVNYENAVNQIEELSSTGTKAFLFGQAGGFHRVALGSFATEAEAVAFMNKARANGQPNCWLLEE